MIAENIQNLNNRIARILAKQNRSMHDILLLAVTKTHPIDTIEEALQNGIDAIAENKVQEAEQKIPFLKFPFKEFHFIGHLQSNKISKLMALKPTLIHSIDTYSIAEKLNEYCQKHHIVQPILIQVNTSGEKSKSGIFPIETSAFVLRFEALKNLQIQGLMTISKRTDKPDEIRKCFRVLKELFDELRNQNFPFMDLKHLSMGMTDDFSIALEEGATILRIGSAIFGQREYKK
jgi:hypothetical protein